MRNVASTCKRSPCIWTATTRTDCTSRSKYSRIRAMHPHPLRPPSANSKCTTIRSSLAMSIRLRYRWRKRTRNRSPIWCGSWSVVAAPILKRRGNYLFFYKFLSFLLKFTVISYQNYIPMDNR